MNKDNGGAAFPHGVTERYQDVYGEEHTSEYSQPGMTLRDYFAAKVCAAIWSNSKAIESLTENPKNKGLTFGQMFAQEAYRQADAMLEERNK